MSVVIVGGHDRMNCQYKEICKRYGCKCKVFTQCPADFHHKMLKVVSLKASKTGVAVKYCNSSSACALKECLDSHLQTV